MYKPYDPDSKSNRHILYLSISDSMYQDLLYLQKVMKATNYKIKKNSKKYSLATTCRILLAMGIKQYKSSRMFENSVRILEQTENSEAEKEELNQILSTF